MAGVTFLERKRRRFERYPIWFALGLAILVVSLILMGVRQLNEQTRLAEIYAGNVSPPSAALVAATQLELALSHVIEQLVFLGLAAIKVGIGFSIAVIVLNLRETGRRGIEEFVRAGVTQPPPEAKMPWFARFPPFLVLGFLIVLFFFLLTFVWVYNEFAPIGDQVATRMTLEAIIKPGKTVGTALLLFGIASGLATIVTHLRMQAHALPTLLGAAARRDQVPLSELVLPSGSLRKLFVAPIAGLLVVLTAYVPIAALLAWNRAINLSTAGWSSPAAQSLEVVLEHWIESYVLLGITVILVGIGLWLLAIIRALGQQRHGFLAAVAQVTRTAPPSPPSPLRLVKLVPAFLAIGLAVVVVALGLTAVWIGVGVEAVATGARSAVVADHVWEAFVKPFKFVGLAFVFLGIGMALNVIVVNLKMLASVLPGVFARFATAARGGQPQPLEVPVIAPMSLVPKKLFAGILVGFAVVVTAMLPLSWPLRMGTFDLFLELDVVGSMAAQAAFSLERFLEHLILPYKLTGVGIILYSIGRYFGTIVGFVRARKTLVTEGVGSVADHLAGRASL